MPAKIIAIFGNMVTAEADHDVTQNAVGYCIRADGSKLLSEVIRVRGKHADLQVFEETRALKVGVRSAGGWAIETVLAAANAGDTCDLRVGPDDSVHVVFHHDSQLQHALRRGANDWVVAAADTVGGRNVGLDPSMRFTADGRLVVAHGDGTNGELRVSTRAANGRWSTVASAVPGSAVGLSPRLTLNPRGDVEIAHGVRPGAGQSSDAGLFMTTGPVAGPLRSAIQNGAFLGYDGTALPW